MGHTCKTSNSQPVEKADQGGRLRSVINAECDQECKAYLSKKKKKIGGPTETGRPRIQRQE